jgi:hypothetical protein
MGIFDRDTQTPTMDRPRTDSSNLNASSNQGTGQGRMQNMPGGMSSMMASGSRGSSKPIFKVRWTNQEGEVVSEYMQAMSTSGRVMATLNITKPEGWPAGHYKLEFMLNDTTAAMMDFEVR